MRRRGFANDGVMWRSSRRPSAGSRYGFEYLSADEVYLDSACQTLRPQPVIDALAGYYTAYGACGDRVKYPWGRKVDAEVAETRAKVLAAFGLSPRRYAACFTLNTTFGVNLLLHQLPVGRYRRVVTTHTEHNSVFLPVIACAQRTGVERIVLERDDDGRVRYEAADLDGALVVLSAMNNVDGAVTTNLAELIADAHRGGGVVIVDAAQAAPHALEQLRGLPADAFCFSAHKMYGASLGVVVAALPLLASLEVSFLGGGQITGLTESGYELLPDLTTRLEPGLQAWGEIIALGAALDWSAGFRAATGETVGEREERLSGRLFDGLATMPRVALVNARASSVISFLPERVDAHRLAAFLGSAGVMVRSGHFCAHHWLSDQRGLEPLVRFSVGAHNDEADIERALDVMTRLMKGL